VHKGGLDEGGWPLAWRADNQEMHIAVDAHPIISTCRLHRGLECQELRARVAFGKVAGATATAAAPNAAERGYASCLVKQRLHQAAF